MTQGRFPRGLMQPQGAYRFGLEALLLAAFAVRTVRGRGASREMAVSELGSGCGAALLGVALRLPRATCLGLEREASLVAAARANAEALGLSGRVRFILADVAAAPLPETNPQDVVLANPPWGLPGRGRRSPSALREGALRAPADTPAGDAFPVFCAAAARLLRHKGLFCCIVPASALTRICAALAGARLGLRRILPLRPHSGKSAHRLLLLAQKGACAEPELCSPLTLHRRAASTGLSWTRAALAFCPWLAAQADAAPTPHGDAP